MNFRDWRGMIDWKPYLESVCEKYSRWWEMYAFTSAKEAEKGWKAEDPRASFDLLAEVLKKKEETESDEERRYESEREEVELPGWLSKVKKSLEPDLYGPERLCRNSSSRRIHGFRISLCLVSLVRNDAFCPL